MASRKLRIVGGIVLLLGTALVFLLFRPIMTPRVTATFSGFDTNKSDRSAVFSITNHSKFVIHLSAYKTQTAVEVTYLQDAQTLKPGYGCQVPVLVELPRNGTITFQLRRQDTVIERARELIDNILWVGGIRIQGLNPESHRFQVTGELP